MRAVKYREAVLYCAYSAAKAGVNNYTQWLAMHMATNYSPDIRVNVIAPGLLAGEQIHRLL